MDDQNYQAWRDYLLSNQVLSNPFSQDNWQDHPKQFERTFLTQSVIQMEYTLNIKDEITDRLNELTAFTTRTKKNQAVQVISSLPGGGKTRLLLELTNLLKHDNWDAIYLVTFDDPSAVSSSDTMAEESIAMRILYYAVRLSNNDTPWFSDWLADIQKKGLKEIDNIHYAIRLIGGDPEKKCVVAVDEVNMIIKYATSTVGNASSESSMAAKNHGSIPALGRLIKCLGLASIDKSGIVSVIAGTLIRTFFDAATLSRVNINTNILDVLSYDQQSMILDNIPRMKGWRCCKAAKDRLSTLGGVPRLLEWFVDTVNNLMDERGWDCIDFPNLPRRNKGNIMIERYTWKSPSIELARKLVDVIMTRTVIGDSNWDVLPGVKQHGVTYESLQHNGQILLVEVVDGFTVSMPLLTFKGLVRQAAQQVTDDCSRFQRLHELLREDPSKWEDFEKFGAEHTAVMNGFLAYHTQPFAQPQFTLSQIYAAGLGGARNVSVRLINKAPYCLEWGCHFPKKPTNGSSNTSDWDFADGNCYINGLHAPCSDAFYVCQSADTRPGPRPSRVLIAEQYKQRTASGLTYENCREEHQKNLNAWKMAQIEGKEDYRIVTVIITTCEVIHYPTDHHKDTELLVIDINGLSDLYGVLMPMFKTASFRVSDINTMNQAELREYLGASTASILQLRELEGGFQGLEHLVEQVEKAGLPMEEHWKESVNHLTF